MTDPNVPDYGTRPEPKYGAYDDHLMPTPPPVKTKRDSVPEPTRSVFGIVLALFVLLVGGTIALAALQGGWWSLLWVLAVPTALMGVAGFIIDVRKVPRDENGRPL